MKARGLRKVVIKMMFFRIVRQRKPVLQRAGKQKQLLQQEELSLIPPPVLRPRQIQIKLPVYLVRLNIYLWETPGPTQMHVDSERKSDAVGGAVPALEVPNTESEFKAMAADASVFTFGDDEDFESE
jgi:hypothetical protein